MSWEVVYVRIVVDVLVIGLVYEFVQSMVGVADLQSNSEEKRLIDCYNSGQRFEKNEFVSKIRKYNIIDCILLYIIILWPTYDTNKW